MDTRRRHRGPHRTRLARATTEPAALGGARPTERCGEPTASASAEASETSHDPRAQSVGPRRLVRRSERATSTPAPMTASELDFAAFLDALGAADPG
jgi:hypothetical protein